jgi:hypothetical protein
MKPEGELVDILSYFVVLPNYVFSHFPVIDYRALARGYFASGIHEIERTGVVMLRRGTMHLMVRRVVDRLLLVSAGMELIAAGTASALRRARDRRAYGDGRS